MPSGGSGGGAAPAAGGAAAGGAAEAEEAPAEKEEGLFKRLSKLLVLMPLTEKEESDEDMGFGLFD